MEASLLVRGKKEGKALLLKLGFALALSLAGYFASQFRRPKPQRFTIPKPSKGGDDELKQYSAKPPKVPGHGLKDELQIISDVESLAKIINETSSVVIDKEELSSPEFNELMKKESEVYPDTRSVEAFEERLEMEKEIKYLRNLVEELKERERNLETQMIDYYGLKEQDASLQELENRLKVHVTEHKLLSLKIESLQSDNQKLQGQVSDYQKVASELEDAREEIKLLKAKLKSDGEHAKEKLASLHRRIMEMLDRERKQGEEEDVPVKKKLKEIEDEVVDLTKVKARLVGENLKFAEQLESIKMKLSSQPKQTEVEALGEAQSLREDNQKLKKKIEQLHTDRCADVEELVYLRWVNACLRYELRNYQPIPGKAVAKDLSKCMSPESEKKAKQLILDYSNSVTDRKNMNLFDFDTSHESCSSSQTSSEDFSDTSIGICSSTKNGRSSKSKLFSKIKKLVVGKNHQQKKVDSADRTTTTSCGSSTRKASGSPCSSEDMNGRRNSFDSVSSCISVENTSTSHLNGSEQHSDKQWQTAQSLRQPRPSLDVQRMRKLNMQTTESLAERCKSDLGTSRGHMRMVSEDCLNDMRTNLEHQDAADVPEKVKLKKFASVLKNAGGPLKMKKRQTS